MSDAPIKPPVQRPLPSAQDGWEELCVGDVAAEPPPVYVREPVLVAARRHAMGKEVRTAGFLVGDRYLDPTRRSAAEYLEVEAFIPAELGQASVGTFTFTHETWLAFLATKRRDFPDKLVVGWFISHPVGPLSLSDSEVFIHDNFYVDPWMVVLVVDGPSQREAFFRTLGGMPRQIGHVLLRRRLTR